MKSKRNEQNLKTVNGVEDLVFQICEKILGVMPRVGVKLGKDGATEIVSMTNGFIWLRITSAQLSDLFSANPAEADLAAMVAGFPADVPAIVSARFDVHVRRLADGIFVSIAQGKCEPKYFFQELTEPYNPMHGLHVVFDPGYTSDQQFVFAEFSAGGLELKGWVDSEKAKEWAAEGGAYGIGRAPDFRVSIPGPGSVDKGGEIKA